ncbi:uncharacterized protein LOC106129298 [Amyelois transitella]|uniref:uncharacterized protein LOC106129298 n=1 Tax=Amyelois transitella TaxID=680683 RepID=UPI00067C65E0|nr:uncharacterized protein LOC106129298 [Amyelois transitella]
MEDTPVNFIRESTRNLLKLNRRIHRDVESDTRRHLENRSITPELIADIANRLKSKPSVTTQELQILKNALVDDQNNLNVVLGTNGALRGLVREISGINVKRQCAAAGCCCNLALGDSKSCRAVAKAAGPYLVSALDNLTTELAVTCAWAIGNMAGSGTNVCNILIAQGALTKLIDLQDGHEDIRDAALYALVHFVYQLKDSLSVEHLEKITAAIFKRQFSMASSQLLFIISCHEHFNKTELPETLLLKLIQATSVSTQRHISTCKGNQCCELIYLIRTLANVVINEKYSTIVLNQFIVEDVYKLGLKKIVHSDNKILVESLLWLLGVLHKYCDQDIFRQMIFGA